jgi:hypothetical protein
MSGDMKPGELSYIRAAEPKQRFRSRVSKLTSALPFAAEEAALADSVPEADVRFLSTVRFIIQVLVRL